MSHEHTHTINNSEETLALLKYMADHNIHHATELNELAHGVNEEANNLIHKAVEKLNESNALLIMAIEAVEGKG